MYNLIVSFFQKINYLLTYLLTYLLSQVYLVNKLSYSRGKAVNCFSKKHCIKSVCIRNYSGPYFPTNNFVFSKECF